MNRKYFLDSYKLRRKQMELKKGFSVLVMIAFLVLSAVGNGNAQGNSELKGLTLGGNIGYGRINYNYDNKAHQTEDTLALGFQGGYAITRNIILGVEFNGWTLEGFDLWDMTKGESVSNYSLFADLFPFNAPLYFVGGAGVSRYINNNPDIEGRESGTALFIGLGYEFPITKSLKYAPQIRYSRGSYSGGDYYAAELAIAVHWYAGK